MNPEYMFKTAPYAHQEKCYLLSRDMVAFACFMEMGTGKTKVIIDTIGHLYLAGKIDAAVIIAPKGVYLNWLSIEIPTHLSDAVPYDITYWHAYDRHLATHKKRLEDFMKSDKARLQIIVVNVDSFASKFSIAYFKKFVSTRRTFMVVDESTQIKSLGSARTKNLIKIGRTAAYRRIMTGYSAPESPLDLYAQCEFLDGNILGYRSFITFRARYAILKEMQFGQKRFKVVDGYQRLDELQNKVAPYSFRVQKSECLDLPEKIYEQRFVSLGEEQGRIYKEMKKRMLAEVEGGLVSATMALTLIIKLHQITCGFVKLDDGQIRDLDGGHTPRLRELLETIEEIDGKVIIWASFRHSLEKIAEALVKRYGEAAVATFHGGTLPEDRQAIVHRFQNKDSKLRFFVGQPRAGGFGLTLTQSSNTIYFSNDYSLENRIQSEDRNHRIGQHHPVTYVDLIAKNTVDEKIIKILKGKKKIGDELMGDQIKDWLA